MHFQLSFLESIWERLCSVIRVCHCIVCHLGLTCYLTNFPLIALPNEMEFDRTTIGLPPTLY